MKKIFQNKSFYIILISIIIILALAGIYIYDKVSINNNFLKFEEKFLTNYSKDKFIKNSLVNVNIYNKSKIVKYVKNNYNDFLKKNSNLSASIRDFADIYDDAISILANLKRMEAICEKDYISMNSNLNKLDFGKISDKLLYLTLKKNSNDILGEKTYFEGLIAELMFRNELAEKYYLKAINLNGYNPKYYNALSNIYYYKYNFNQAINTLEIGLNNADFNNKKYKNLNFKLLLNSAKVYSVINDYDNAKNTYTYISVVAKNNDNMKYEYLAIYNLANIELNIGNYKTALDYLKYSLKLASKLDNKEYIAQTLNSLSIANYRYGDYSNGKKNGLKAIKLAKKLSNLSLIADASLNVCLNYEYLYKGDLAHIYCEKAIRINNVLNNNLDRPEYSAKNGYIYSFVANVRDYNSALSYYKESYENAKKFGLKLSEIKSMYGLSECNNVLGNKVDALKYLDDAMNLEILLNIEEQACSSCKYGFIYWGKKNYQKAINYYEKGLIKAFVQNNKVVLANVSSHLASINFELKKYQEALKYSTLSLNTDKKIYRYDHHYIKYQEDWQNRIIEEMNNNKKVNNAARKVKNTK